jgi:hypothetical protein
MLAAGVAERDILRDRLAAAVGGAADLDRMKAELAMVRAEAAAEAEAGLMLGSELF